MKDKFMNFRATDKEKKQLAILAKKAKLSQAEFIRHSVFNKEIIIIDGLKELQKELKRIGNNLNQLTTRANMGQLSVINLETTKDEIANIHERLAELCTSKDEKVHPETGSAYDEESEVDTAKKDVQCVDAPQPNAPNQCNSSEDDSPKQGVISEDKSNDEQIVHRQNFDELTEQTILSAPLPKLGERRSGSVFGNVFGRNRGE